MARNYAGIVSEAMARLRLDANDAALLAMVQGWANDVIQDIHGRHDWFWTLDRQIVQTVKDITSGTVSVAASGTTVTGTSTAFASGDVGKFIQFQGSNDWYKITAVASATSLTIEAGYNGTTALSAGTYTIRKLFYSLPNAEKLVNAKQTQTWKKITSINHKDFSTYMQFGGNTSPADLLAIFGQDSSGNLQFMLYPAPDTAYNLEIPYKKKASESDLSAIPEKRRHIYIDGILVRGLEYVSLGQPNFDARLILQKKADYEGGIGRMLADAEPESDYTPVLQNRDVVNTLPTPHLPEGLSIPLD